MRAVVFDQPGAPLTVQERPDPEAGEGELVLRVRACGICASDLHAAQTPDFLPSGTVMGHEFVGEVMQVGAGVDGWQVGQRATALPDMSCGDCDACRTNRSMECPQMVSVGFSDEVTGAFAEYVKVNASVALPVDDAIPDEAAAMVEPLAVGFDAVRRGRLSPSDRVLVIGAGPIGLTVVQWCRVMGVQHVVANDLVADRLEVARQVGATAVIDGSQDTDVIAAYRRETGTEPTVIFEVVGAPGMIQRCIEMAGYGTRIVVVGVCMSPDTILPVEAIQKALDLSFCYGYTRDDWAYILEMIQQGRIETRPIVTSSVGLDDFPDTFERLQGRTDELKVLLTPGGAS